MSTRKVHGKRITSPSNDEKWVDILRVDGLVDIENAGGQRQTLKLKWEDDGDNNNPARAMEDVPVPSLSDDFVIPAIKRMRTNNSGQVAYHTFKNSSDNTVREMVVKRIYATDLEVPDGGAVDWGSFPAAYAAATSENTDDYLDVGITIAFGRKQQQGRDYQGSVFHLRNKPLLDVMEDAPGGPDVVLDPFQIIVNFKGHTTQGGIHGLLFVYDIAPSVPGGATEPPLGDIYCEEWFEIAGSDGPFPAGTRVVASTGYWHAVTPGDGATITITNPILNRSNPFFPPDTSVPDYWTAGTYSADQIFVRENRFPETGELVSTTYSVYIPVPRFGS